MVTLEKFVGKSRQIVLNAFDHFVGLALKVSITESQLLKYELIFDTLQLCNASKNTMKTSLFRSVFLNKVTGCRPATSL